MQYAAPNQAIRSINQALTLDPNLGDGYSVRAVVMYLIGDRQGSDSDFNRAIELEVSFKLLPHFTKNAAIGTASQR